MDTLPIELIPFIFQHLPLRDLAQCRLTCKKFRYFADRTKLTELFINDENELIACTAKWCYTDREINLKNKIDISHFRLLASFPFDLSGLKRLIINFNMPYAHFDPNFVNKLTTLNHLELWNLGDPSTGFEDSQQMRLTLKLDQLKVLFVGLVSLRLLINAPSIEALFLYSEESGYDAVEFSHPHSVKHIEFDYLTNENLRQFLNVEHVKCSFSHALILDLLEILPNLKELHCDQEELTRKDDYDLLVSGLNHLIEQRTLLARDNLEIYFKKTKLLRTKRFEKYGFYSNLEIKSLA